LTSLVFFQETTSEGNRNPLNTNILCGAARETCLLAAVRGGFLDVAALLLQQSDSDPNVVAKPIEYHNDPRISDEIYGFSNVPLAEAARQKSLAMCDLLLKFGAKDDQSTALSIAINNSDEQIICRLLAIKAFPDPDYKINKKSLAYETDLPTGVKTASVSNLTYSSLFPNTPTMINWHSNNCYLQCIKMQWY
jgi:ankyrin repeat protein